tara:strand:- start:988 stop:1320 length:333 start_codon:yes stop_codon:yes gene_type:complete
MSKKKESSASEGQVKPKLKIKVNFNNQQHILNEYDMASMISELNVKVMHLSQAVNGITDAMAKIAGQAKVGNITQQYETGSPYSTEPVQVPEIKLPTLNKVEENPVKLQS